MKSNYRKKKTPDSLSPLGRTSDRCAAAVPPPARPPESTRAPGGPALHGCTRTWCWHTGTEPRGHSLTHPAETSRSPIAHSTASVVPPHPHLCCQTPCPNWTHRPPCSPDMPGCYTQAPPPPTLLSPPVAALPHHLWAVLRAGGCCVPGAWSSPATRCLCPQSSHGSAVPSPGCGPHPVCFKLSGQPSSAQTLDRDPCRTARQQTIPQGPGLPPHFRSRGLPPPAKFQGVGTPPATWHHVETKPHPQGMLLLQNVLTTGIKQHFHLEFCPENT